MQNTSTESDLKYAAGRVCSFVVVSLGSVLHPWPETLCTFDTVVRRTLPLHYFRRFLLFRHFSSVPAGCLINRTTTLAFGGVVTVLLLLMPFQVWTPQRLDSQIRSLGTLNFSNVPDELPMVKPRQILWSLVARIRNQSLLEHTAGINCVGQQVKKARA